VSLDDVRGSWPYAAPMEEATWWGVEVGPWSEWVAAVLTGGSLLLGFYILPRDRRKRLKRSPAGFHGADMALN
jgi:hypothetical protein